MLQVECAYNILQRGPSGELISLKEDQISFTDNYGVQLLKIVGTSDVFTGAQIICKACGQCSPEINKVNGGVKILRHEYYFEPESDLPFLTIERKLPQGRPRAKITCFDDNWDIIQNMRHHLSNNGFLTTGIFVNTDTPFSAANQWILYQAILESRPNAVIGDKGIG